MPVGYSELLKAIKAGVQAAQTRAALAVNSELLKLYWWIGEQIAICQKEEGWGAGIIARLAKDLLSEFPGIAGFSRTNLFRMKAWHQAYAIIPQAVGQLTDLPIFSIPWGHNIVLIEQLKDNDQRLWYAQRCLECGWSRNVLEMQIESGLYDRKGKALTNFQQTLPAPPLRFGSSNAKGPLRI